MQHCAALSNVGNLARARFSLHAPNPQPANGGDALLENRSYLCTFCFLCFSLAFFLKGVLVGVGDGVPVNSGVGDGRTRG